MFLYDWYASLVLVLTYQTIDIHTERAIGGFFFNCDSELEDQVGNHGDTNRNYQEENLSLENR